MFAYKTTTGSAPLYLNSLLQTYVPLEVVLTFFPPGRTMVQVQVSRAAHISFTYYVINSNQPDL